MSQYPSHPSPYPGPQSYQPGYGYDPAEQMLAPARRAGVLMMVLGALSLACGLCIGLTVWLVPIEQVIAQSGIELPDTSELHMSAGDLMRIAYTVVAAIALLGAAVMIVLGAFVRRGGMGSIVTSIVLGFLLLLLLLANVAQAFVMLARAPNSPAMIGTCLVAVMLALNVLLLVWLFQAAKAAPAIKAYREQYRAQWWQYQQQPMYGQGYAPPPQQPPPPPPTGGPDERPPNA